MPESESFHDETDPNAFSKEDVPSSGVRPVQPGEVLNTAFDGTVNAGDFLGLDEDVAAPVPGELQLTDIDPYGTGGTGGAAAEDDEIYDSPEDDFEDDELTDFSGGSETFEEPIEDEVLAEAGSSSKAGAYLAAFALGLVGVAGVVLGPKVLPQYFGKGEVEVATKTPTTTPKPVEPAQPAAAAATEAEPEEIELLTEADASDEAPFFADDAAPTDGLVEAPDEAAADIEDLEGLDAGSLLAETLSGFGDDASPEEPAEGGLSFDMGFLKMFGGGSDATSELPNPGGLEGLGQGQTFDASLLASEGWMDGELVDMVWRDASVPTEAFDHPVRVMTPRVGNVRVHMTNNEVFEGRLYAVGQQRVWIDSQHGRLGLDADEVVEVELANLVGSVTDSFDPTGLGTGKRVRVQVPGGVLYGRVLSVVEENVTLITDGGARVVLAAPDIEPLGPARAILVER